MICKSIIEGSDNLHGTADLRAGEDVREPEVPLILGEGGHGKAPQRH